MDELNDGLSLWNGEGAGEFEKLREAEQRLLIKIQDSCFITVEFV